jgi:hypothetical protein
MGCVSLFLILGVSAIVPGNDAMVMMLWYFLLEQ